MPLLGDGASAVVAYLDVICLAGMAGPGDIPAIAGISIPNGVVPFLRDAVVAKDSPVIRHEEDLISPRPRELVLGHAEVIGIYRRLLASGLLLCRIDLPRPHGVVIMLVWHLGSLKLGFAVTGLRILGPLTTRLVVGPLARSK